MTIEELYMRKIIEGLMETVRVIFNKPFGRALVEYKKFGREIARLHILFLHLLGEKAVTIRIWGQCPMSGHACLCLGPL